MDIMTLGAQLIDLGACEEAIDWVGERTIEQAVAECERGDWLEWLVSKLDLWTMACTQARRAYAEAYDQALRAYEESRAKAWRACEEACAQASQAYAEALRAAMPELSAQVRAELKNKHKPHYRPAIDQPTTPAPTTSPTAPPMSAHSQPAK
jgi:hypothetical protein